MTPQNFESLPIILVSAKDEASATTLITEIIDNIPEDSTCDGDSQNTINKVWRIQNKYYTADVRLHPLGDQQELKSSLEGLIEAHVIYLSPEEVRAGGERAVSARAGRVRVADAVRLVALEAADEPAPLAAAALAAHYEPVPLRATAPGAGLPRLRDALHAHVWPAPRAPDRDRDDDEWGPWCEAGADDAAFAAALGALPAAAAAARSVTARAERLAAAEQVLAAFCRALHMPPP